MNKMTVVSIGAALLFAATAASAEMYRWVDSKGKVHYSDRPVQGAEQVEVKVPGGSGSSEAPAKEAKDDSAKNKADKKAGAGDPSGVTDDDELKDIVRAEQCNKAKKELETLETASDVYEEDASGGRRMLSTDERVDRIISARKSVSSYCASSDS